jgi:hypothetical protein
MMSAKQMKRVKKAKRTTMTIFNEETYEHPALCIPRGLGRITHQELTSIVNKTGLGEIYKIIIKPREFILPEWERTTSHSIKVEPEHEHEITDYDDNHYVAADITSKEMVDGHRHHHHHHPHTPPDNAHKVFYSNIYIYFKKWNTDNPTVRKYRNNLINGQSIKIVHNTIPTPIFWRCVAANFHRR